MFSNVGADSPKAFLNGSGNLLVCSGAPLHPSPFLSEGIQKGRVGSVYMLKTLAVGTLDVSRPIFSGWGGGAEVGPASQN